MLTRRDFGLLGASAGLTLVTVGETNAQGLTKIRAANASGVIDSQVIFLTVGMNPKVNFYAEEGIQQDIINMSGVSQTIQAVTTGNSEISPVSPPGLLSIAAKNPEIDLVCAYCWLRQVHWGIGVKPDSPIKTVAELKGKKVGIRNQGDTGFIGAKAMVAELGIDPNNDGGGLFMAACVVWLTTAVLIFLRRNELLGLARDLGRAFVSQAAAPTLLRQCVANCRGH